MTRDTLRIDVEGVGAFDCAAGETVLKAMERVGAAMLGIGCRGGGCGICKVRVTRGRYLTRPMSASRVSATERVSGYALGCRLTPLSDLTLVPAWSHEQPSEPGSTRV